MAACWNPSLATKRCRNSEFIGCREIYVVREEREERGGSYRSSDVSSKVASGPFLPAGWLHSRGGDWVVQQRAMSKDLSSFLLAAHQCDTQGRSLAADTRNLIESDDYCGLT